MKINEWLSWSSRILKTAGIATVRLDCLVLLEDATGKDRAYLLAHPETTVQGPSLHKLNRQIRSRSQHIPLAYIRGKTEFYGREFIVNKHVLEPRPESEMMVDLLRKLVDSRQFTVDSNAKNKELRHKRSCGVQGASEQRTEPYQKYGDGAAQFATQQSAESTSRVAGFASQQAGASLTVVDVGTGCGALGITAKLEFPNIEIILTDIDPNCLKVARQNAKKHKVNVAFLQGNLLEPLLETGDWRLETGKFAILANLPYVPDSHTINQAAMQEPKIAIFGGPDGLDLYRQLFSQLSKNKWFITVKYVLTESLPPQHKSLAKIAKNHGYKQYQEDDFIQCFARL